MDRIELELYLNNLLETARFKDYCPNGLQVEGRRRVNKLATGVTASVAFLEAALEWGADAVLVHHGYFWRNEAPQITGRKYARLKTLIANDLNLFAYHLPLDSTIPSSATTRRSARRWAGSADDALRRERSRLDRHVAGADHARALHGDKSSRRSAARRSCSATRIANCVAWRWCTGGAQGYVRRSHRRRRRRLPDR